MQRHFYSLRERFLELQHGQLVRYVWFLMAQQSRLLGLLALFLCMAVGPLRGEDLPPRSSDPRVKIELFAENPQIATPTGIDVDHQGRLWAIESNTHFPPEGYKGHPTDRLLVMRDLNHDGKAEEITVFADGFTHAMSIAVRPMWYPVPAGKSGKGEVAFPKLSVYLATRREILLLHDDDGDLKADRQERLVHLDTAGNYPHTGWAGFAFDAAGWMFFGFGENLGADYKVIGSDGTVVSGGGEGGSIFRARLDGTRLSRWSTGFWNPHASCIDAFGHMFSVDNDPDSRPPCRLLHIVPGGDYGYRFRNGRKGLHPFTAWNGEIPGTLPMVAGTGEAPSGIVAYEADGLPADYLGNLLVGSWGDHRIDRFKLTPKGSSFTSLAEPLITGSENFRPVGLAVAPDGSVYCSDWVSRDYNVHGKGRIWRISALKLREQPAPHVSDLVNATEIRLFERLHSANVSIRRAAAYCLGKTAAGRSLLVTQFADPTQTTRSRLEAFWATVNLSLEAEPPTDLLVVVRSLAAASTTPPVTEIAEVSRSNSRGGGFGGSLAATSYLTSSDEVLCSSYWLRGTGQVNSILCEQVLALGARAGLRNQRRDASGSPLGLAFAVARRNTPPKESTSLFPPAISDGLTDPFQFCMTVQYLALVENPEVFRSWWSDRQAVSPASGDLPNDQEVQALMDQARVGGDPVQRAAILSQLQQLRQGGARGGRVSEQAANQSHHMRLALVLAARQRFPKDQELVSLFLKDPEQLVKRLAVQWAAEEKLKGLRPQVEAILSDPVLTSDLFLATLAGLEMLDGVNPVEFDKTPASKYVLPLVQKDGPSAVRMLALRMAAPDDPALTLDLFKKLLVSPDEKLRLEAIRTLQLSPLPGAADLLVAVAGDAGQSDLARAEAIAGLTTAVRSTSLDNSARKILNKILLGDKQVLKIESLRTLRGTASTGPEALAIKRLAESLNAPAEGNAVDEADPANNAEAIARLRARQAAGGRGGMARNQSVGSELQEQIHRALADPKKPAILDGSSGERSRTLQEWYQISAGVNSSGPNAGMGGMGAVPGAMVAGPMGPGMGRNIAIGNTRGDVAAGRRVFFHANSAGCFKCHTVDGRGGKVGPDLTTIARTMDRSKLTQSILEPSREISPQFVSWNFQLTSGQVLQGLLISEESEKLKIASADGKVHDLTLKEIEARAPQSLSLMPEKLADQLTTQEFLDLIAFLETLK
jgi:putative membrane-bound dehydrogenase-like protein